ncbi:MAG: Holliday junction branch migration protein RuvA [Oscillospiraceae bacterium]|nr:Holliday junction branch migration protein RuvA [Oscillospiraceae bacterium]
MYAYIKGTLDSIRDDYVIVEAFGVGYKIYTPFSTISELPKTGEQVKLYTHFVVREDANLLYGFLTNEELSMFEMLLAVSGVGPKVAVAVISAVSPAKFGLAVLTGDSDSLKSAQGVGKKLAQKICFELGDKMRKERPEFTGLGADDPGLSAVSSGGKMSEAVSALTILGYTHFEANRAVSAVYSNDLELEQIIKEALRNMGK